MHNNSVKGNRLFKLKNFMNKIACSKVALLTMAFVALSQLLIAQPMMSKEKVQMADGLRSSGKIYVVVAVLLTVLAGLFIYLVNVDRKITKLEKENQS